MPKLIRRDRVFGTSLHAITAEAVQKWLEDECATRPTFAHNSYRKFRTFIKWCAKQEQYKEEVHPDCCLA
jgi:hypothetical protein